MSWRTVVISKNAKLEERLNYLQVRDAAGVQKIHLSEIGILIIESTAVSLTAGLLCELTKRKIKVIFCDEKRNPQSELVSYYQSCDVSLKVKNQISWLPDIKQAVWTLIVREKILNQARLLHSLGKPEYEMLLSYAAELQPGDATNREGHAAKVYFNALFGKSFTRTQDTPQNAALNYGYSIVLSSFNRELAALGYLTQLGLFHDNRFNNFNLSCDLMEPFRPLVDKKVLTVLFENDFTHTEKMMILDILNDDITISGRHQTVSNAIKIYCKSVTDALCENDISLIRFYQYE